MTLRKAAAARTRLIRDAQAEIERLLHAAGEQAAAVLAGAPSDYQLWRLQHLRAEIRRVLTDVAPKAADAAEAALIQSWALGAAAIDGVMAAPALTAAMPAIDRGQLDAMRAFTTDKISGATLDAMDRISDQLALTMIGTQTPFEAVQEVTKILGESTRKRATSIVRTELATAYSTANQLRLEQWGSTVPGLKKRWVKSGKVHPRIEHAVIHGQVRDVGKPFDLEGGTVQMMQPHDPGAPLRHRINCGCMSVPVVPGYSRTIIDEKEQEAAEEAARGRAALAAAQAPHVAPAPAPAATLQTAQAIYAQALAGGRHAGFVARLRDQGPNQWRRGIASQQERMDAHLAKLANPAAAVADWSQRSPLYQQGLLKKWQREVDEAREQKAIVEEYRNAQERTE